MGSLGGLLTIAADGFDFASAAGLIEVFEPVRLGGVSASRRTDGTGGLGTNVGCGRLGTRDGARCVCVFVCYVVGRVSVAVCGP